MQSIYHLLYHNARKCAKHSPDGLVRVAPVAWCLALGLVCCTTTAAAAAAVTIDGVVCTVNGIPVLRSEVNELIADGKFTKEKWDSARHTLMKQKLLERIAEEEGIKVTDEEVEKQLDLLLKKRGYTREDVKELLPRHRREMRRFLITGRVIFKKVAHKIAVPPAEVRNYYEEHKLEEYHEKEQRRIRMISALAGKAADPEAPRKAAREKIERAMQRLKEGEDFILVARKESDDGHAEAGGDWGWKQKEDLVEALDKAAFSLAVGQVSGIIETPEGFHIMKVEERRAESCRPFKDVEEKIRDKLWEDEYGKERAKYVQSLIDKAVIKTYDNGPEE